MARKTDSDSILEISTGLFREKGLRATSMADIASGSSLKNKASLYHHFPSKDAILLKVLDRANERFEQDAFAPAYDASRPRRERMQALMEGMRDYFQDNRICLMAHISLEDTSPLPSAREKIRSFFLAWQKALAQLLSPQYAPDEAQNMAVDLIARVEGGGIWFHLFDDLSPLQRVCDEAVALIRDD